MKVQLLAVGSRMPAWVTQGYQEYEKRIPKELKPHLVEIALAHRAKGSGIEEARDAEGRAILAARAKSARLVILDVQGKPWSTADLAMQMQQWMMDGRDVDLVIGGPDGLSANCLNQADQRWSLSSLTLPHPLVRVIFIEQWYRAWTILANHPYHK